MFARRLVLLFARAGKVAEAEALQAKLKYTATLGEDATKSLGLAALSFTVWNL
jgi:hypothetical protein